MPTCEWCKKEFKHQGALNLHKSIHCKKKPPAAAGDRDDECADGCDWRLLNRSKPNEYRAMVAGHKEVCNQCQTLR